MVPELNMARKHGEIKFDMVSQMRTSRDEWLILVSVVLVNIAFLVILLEVKMLKVRFQTRSPFWHAQVICTCAHTRSEMKSYQLQLFIPVFWNALKKQLNFVGPLTCAKNFIFQGPCTNTEEFENRKQKFEQKTMKWNEDQDCELAENVGRELQNKRTACPQQRDLMSSLLC